MQESLKQLISFTICVSLFPLVYSSSQHVKTTGSHTNELNDIHHKLSSKLVFEITLHGILLWASIGFLMPVGILTIRMSHREECGKRLKILFLVHSISQVVCVLVSTAGAVMSIKNFNNAFNNNHQRIGVAVYGIIWLQTLIGFLRPHRGSKARSLWLFVHWMLGTTVSVLGVINIYTGLQAYHQKTSKSIGIWTIIFSIQVCLLVFFYLLQDKWVYMQKQGVILGHETVRITSHHLISPHLNLNNHKDSIIHS